MKKLLALLGVLLLVTTAMPAVSALSASLVDRVEYIGSVNWFNASDVVPKNMDTIAGGYVQDVRIYLPWDDHVVASDEILTHDLVFHTDDGKDLFYVTAIGATDYNRGTYTQINLIATGWERYSVFFPEDGYSKHNVYAGPTGGTSTSTIRVTVSATDEASAKAEAEMKVKAGLELLGSGIENSISLSAEVVERISETKEFVVEVSFTQAQYRFEVGYQGYLTHTLNEKCKFFCPVSASFSELPSDNIYTKIETKPFELNLVFIFWSFPSGVDYNSLGLGELPIVYEEVNK
ncbi:hypothetical protein [Thermococcus waiotapuensis]|uniref:Uncharacterized protein n=1 Tax=Thermococcus waiotapuensis TaxID=90909 RepID=A0AAE4NS05_9EURY|nr:hypothetical protein [Thermococcus waiotapuensis]MDV3103273.1 hypothetical protein [Thermococcus waiotapuensis]